MPTLNDLIRWRLETTISGVPPVAGTNANQKKQDLIASGNAWFATARAADYAESTVNGRLFAYLLDLRGD